MVESILNRANRIWANNLDFLNPNRAPQHTTSGVTGDLRDLNYLSGQVPILDGPKLPISEELIKAIEANTKKGASFQFAVSLNLPDFLVKATKQRQLVLWFAPQKGDEQGFAVFDRIKAGGWVETDKKGKHIGIIGDSVDVNDLQLIFDHSLKVRILPSEAEELKGLIDRSIGIIRQSPPESVLTNLLKEKVHPVNIFSEFARRRNNSALNLY